MNKTLSLATVSLAIIALVFSTGCLKKEAAVEDNMKNDYQKESMDDSVKTEVMVDDSNGNQGIVAGDMSQHEADLAKSTVEWKGSKITGSEHVGTVQLKSGSFFMAGGQLAQGEFVIDMTSIVCTDTPAVEGHLKGEDFFDVENHPEARLSITNVTEENGQFMVTADLTIKDVTNPITFPMNVSDDTNFINMVASFEIDRTQWGIKFGSGSFFDNLGDNAINDEISFDVSIVANK